MTRVRAARRSMACAIVVALCALLVVAPARAEPGDDLPPVGADATATGAGAAPTQPGAGTAANDQILTSPSLGSDAAAAPVAPPPPAPQAQEPAPPDTDPRALTDFEPRLSPYGTWVDDEKYGRVWVPDRAIVGDGFSPYATGGHWALDTDGNWVWVSDYAFGDVVFHYGRWTWGSYGWSWIPGYTYAPAWVEWRVPTSSYAYVGWAPAPPSFYWYGGVAVSLWYPPPFYWVFCPSAFLFSPFPYRYYVTRPAYVRSLGYYTRRWEPGFHGGRFGGSLLGAARVPANAVPSRRVAAVPARGAPVSMSARTAGAPATISSRTLGGGPRTAAPDSRAPGLTSRAPASTPTSRTWSEPARTFAPASRTFSPPERTAPTASRPVSPPPLRTAPPSTYAPSARAYAPASRVYSPPARAYSPPGRAYSPARVYSPAVHTYSAPRGYAPSHVYSAPAWHSSPSFHSSGSHHR